MLGANSRRWIVSSKSMTSSQFCIVQIALLTTAFSASAQETNTRSAEMSRTAKSSENSATTTASELQLNADRSAVLDEFEVKINTLLKEVRNQLLEVSNAQWFEENLQNSLRMKSAQACPNIGLIGLIKGNEPFVSTSKMDKQELLYAIEFLNVSINGMLTK